MEKHAKESKPKIGFWDNAKIEAAIAEYNKTGDEQLYSTTLYPAFVQLAEIIYSRLQNNDLTGTKEDCVQEAILHLNRYLPSFDVNRSKAMTWAHMVIKSRYIQLYTKNVGPRNASNPLKQTDEFPPHLTARASDETDSLQLRREAFLTFWTDEQIETEFKLRQARKVARQLVNLVRNNQMSHGYGTRIAKKLKIPANSINYIFHRMARATESHFRTLDL